jgi:phosphoribosylanthranilate isomerase
MKSVVVKVCGVTEADEIEQLERLGVDFFGLQVNLPSSWTVSWERASELALRQSSIIRAMLVTIEHRPDELAKLIRSVRAGALQLGVRTTPDCVLQLRRLVRCSELTIVQEIPYTSGHFVNERHVDWFLDAGADYILLDRFRIPGDDDAVSRAEIPALDLAAFRDRHPGIPILVAGGIDAQNVAAAVAASGAAGIDVCTSVRRGSRICPEAVADLVQQLTVG